MVKQARVPAKEGTSGHWRYADAAFPTLAQAGVSIDGAPAA